MRPSTHPTHGPDSTWIAGGIISIAAGLAMVPFAVSISLGIGCIVGGVTAIAAAFVRNRPD